MRIEPGKIIGGRYKIESQLGNGAMGEVFLAYDMHLETHRAIKFMSMIGTSRSVYTERFLREAQTAAQLGTHTNVATVHDHFASNKLTYIVMEFVRGKSLEKLLASEAPLTPERAVALMKGICAGVGAAHRNQCVHRDLDPKNIIISTTSEGELPKVIDWGLVKVRDARSDASRTALTHAGTAMGKLAYMAPGDASQAGSETDVYSLGIVMYEMMAGERPFKGPTQADYFKQHLQDEVPAFRRELHIPPQLEDIVRRALAKNPSDRQRDANELSIELNVTMTKLATEKKRKELEKEERFQEEKGQKLGTLIKRLQNEVEKQKRAVAKAQDDLATVEESKRQDAEKFISEIKELRGLEQARLLSLEEKARLAGEEKDLLRELDTLSKARNKVAARTSEVQALRDKAERDAEHLSEALTRMRAAEAERDQAEQERQQIEASITKQVEAELQLLEETRAWALEEQAKLEEEKRRHDEVQEQRMAALEEVHSRTIAEAKKRADREKQLHSEIDSVRIADAEMRRRIEEAETLKLTSEQAYRLAAEKVQRMEAEAHAAALQKEQILAKLEASRRDIAAEAQARSAQEKRVREEIEQFRRLQDEERPRLEAAILQRTASANRLQQMKDRRAEVAAQTEEQLQAASAYARGARQTDSNGDVSKGKSQDQSSRMVSDVETNDEELTAMADAIGSGVQPAVGSYLSSTDPYKRAAAVGELARSQGKEAFPLIAESFDDHSVYVRNAAARALCQLEPARTIDYFNRAIEEGSEERKRNIGSAIASSGLATQAINNLASESREATYNALSILFVMAKTGETEPLVRAIEEHDNDEVRKAVIKLLTLNGRSEIADEALKRRREGQTHKELNDDGEIADDAGRKEGPAKKVWRGKRKR